MADRTLDKFAKDLQRAGNGGLRIRVLRLLKATAITGERHSKSNYGKNGLGVVTGLLRNSIRFDSFTAGSNLGVIGKAGDDADVKYAAVHEFGWPERNIKARPYIDPTMQYLQKRLEKDLGITFRKSVLGSKF